MSSDRFERFHDELARAQGDHDDAVEELARARDRVKRLDAEGTRFVREHGLDEDTAAELARAKAEAIAAATEAAARRGRQWERVGEILERFGDLTDPRVNVGRLADDYPMLLFPLRLETRFRSFESEEGQRHELWVRIFPDAFVIDTFEPVLSETELRDARAYWQEVWRAGGVADGRRAAWRNLVASHGSGRAEWIVNHFSPANPADEPVKGAATDVVLVIATEAPLAGPEATAAAAYWAAVWVADGDSAAEQAARMALEGSVGAARTDEIVTGYRPFNLDDTPAPPLTKADVDVSVAFLVFPAGVETTRSSWTRPAKVDVLPERFVFLGISGGVTVEAIGAPVVSPLTIGPDPSAAEGEGLRPNQGDLELPPELEWLTDFDAALAAGMGLKVDLTPAQAREGFDRVLVLGVRLGADPHSAQLQLEGLLEHHRSGHAGLSVVRQGTPTNNTESEGSGFSRADDADESFDDLEQGPLFTPTTEPLEKRDGQRLAEALGVSDAALQRVRGSDGTDQRDARAMHLALWPATLGYFMDSLMSPVFDDEVVGATRAFFTRYVSGRGPLPAIRVGRQPYGVLLTTAFSRIGWIKRRGTVTERNEREPGGYLARLYELLRLAQADWETVAGSAAHVGAPGSDPQRTLLDILGLHASSVEFHSRYARSIQHLFNHLNLTGAGEELEQELGRSDPAGPGMQLLRALGYSGEERPRILDLYFHRGQAVLDGGLVDDRPLSETQQIRDWTDDQRNYIEWLIDAAAASLDAVRLQDGFTDDRPPHVLLYLLLRHAIMLGYHRTSYELHRTAELLGDAELLELKREPSFVHVGVETEQASESRWADLYKAEPAITGSPDQLVAEHVTELLQTTDLEAEAMRAQLAALELLKDASAARLERALTEHLDCCSYRLDAWLLGLVAYQLEQLRSRRGGDEEAERSEGVYLGAYGWLENLRPKTRALEEVALPPALAETFEGEGIPALVRDPTNGGYVHAPSADHATTAAVLRSGYLANASAANPNTLGVNLSSRRVRLALSLLDGIRSGQSLGALLGYRLERGLHDRHGAIEIDRFVFALRKAFPLRADRLSTTKTDDDVPIEVIEARNVVDGLSLVEHVRRTGSSSYPFGLDLPDAGDAEAAAIDAEVDGLVDVYDALADLALAEGVHQAVRGNFDRASATLAAYTTGQFPPEPEVVRTPSTGVAITHRIGLHLDPAATAPPVDPTPRSGAEPALNAWLAGVLPPLSSIGCRVVWTDPISGTPEEAIVTLNRLRLQPVDLLYLVQTDNQQVMTELDDRVLREVFATAAPRPDAELTIRYLERPTGLVSVFELAPLVRALRSAVLRSRPLRASDVALHNEASSAEDADVFVDRTRIGGVKGELDSLQGDLTTYLASLDPLLVPGPTRTDDVVDALDTLVDEGISLLSRAARFGSSQAGFGFVFAWRRTTFATVLQRVRDLVDRWGRKLTAFDEKIAAYDAIPAATSAADRFALLQQAERDLSTTALPLPATPAALRTALNGVRQTFAAKRVAFEAVLAAGGDSTKTLLQSVGAELPVTDFDLEQLAIDDVGEATVAFASDLAAVVRAVDADIRARADAAQAHLDSHDGTSVALERVAALDAAAKAILGDDFRIVPQFGVPAERGAEWQNAVSASTDLLSYLEQDLKVARPVDEWLYGVAPVRDKARAWQQVVLHADLFGRSEPELTPIQLPFRPDDSWLALQYPPDTVIDGDRLAYTAHYAVPFSPDARQCGLLLDEWTEVLPGFTQTTGISFNFDRPSSEPPQSLLLVTPASWGSGAWRWDDIVAALGETLDLAKLRAVEPNHLDGTPYARFLPAVVLAAILQEISIGTVLAANDQVYERIEPRG